MKNDTRRGIKAARSLQLSTRDDATICYTSCSVAKLLIKITAIFVVCINLHSNQGEKSRPNRTDIAARLHMRFEDAT